MVNGTSLAVEDSSFTSNTALTGGGIFMSRVTDTYIYNSCFYHNNVTQAGGGINAGVHIVHSAPTYCPHGCYASTMYAL